MKNAEGLRLRASFQSLAPYPNPWKKPRQNPLDDAGAPFELGLFIDWFTDGPSFTDGCHQSPVTPESQGLSSSNPGIC